MEADDGYIGEAPGFVKCPKSISNSLETEEMQSIVRCCHETVNQRFKQFGILRQEYRHDVALHGEAFRACAAITQLSIRNMEPLFAVHYVDPYLEDFYFPEEDTESSDDNSSLGTTDDEESV